MVDIKHIHIHYSDLKGKSKSKVIRPTDPESTLEIKKDIAQVISRIKAIAEYYYVVIEINSKGKSAFRTIIPKTFLNA